MATVTVTHASLTGAAANPNVLVDGPKWDAQHAVSGLENVDNTSDANKPVSTATQTALDAKVTGPASVTDDLPAIFDGTTGKLIKSKTYAAFKTLLALVKGDVGLGNVDNTSDATKNSASATLTNKTIDTAGPNTLKVNGNTLAASSGTATVTFPNSTDTLVGKATTDTFSNKTFNAADSGNTLQINSVTVSRGQYPGTSTNDSATAGNVGEHVQTTLSGTLSSSGTAVACGNITLPAGDWDIAANVYFNASNGATTATDWNSIISTSSTPSVASGNSITGLVNHERRPSGADVSLTQSHVSHRVSITSSTTYYLHANATFSAGLGFGVNGWLQARRPR
ncbi:hypothetical protein [Bradyrhizobium sp. 191]|uniref:hypothetical protein n=1 Tax=Bradyrhizobium sp. 191 TaxID=2782659 RepID=UPI0020002D2F|nr:hypothetical protein [Bradyrhizobium sp. 191]UPJ69668.1 hypothetical protein IVB23_26300 [Bradyrhizobium sp. 191]